jgi:hypothetical protein
MGMESPPHPKENQSALLRGHLEVEQGKQDVLNRKYLGT